MGLEATISEAMLPASRANPPPRQVLNLKLSPLELSVLRIGLWNGRRSSLFRHGRTKSLQPIFHVHFCAFRGGRRNAFFHVHIGQGSCFYGRSCRPFRGKVVDRHSFIVEGLKIPNLFFTCMSSRFYVFELHFGQFLRVCAATAGLEVVNVEAKADAEVVNAADRSGERSLTVTLSEVEWQTLFQPIFHAHFCAF